MTIDKLYEKLYIATESMDTVEIERLRPELERLAALDPNDVDVIEMQKWLKLSDDITEIETIQNDLFPELLNFCDGDEESARQMAEELAYAAVG